MTSFRKKFFLAFFLIVSLCLEPGLFVCWYCKEDQSSAWDLIKHVQTVHGIKCYSEPDNKPPHSPPTPITITSKLEGVENLTLSHSHRRRSRSPEPPKAKTMKFDGISFGEDKKADLPTAFPTGIIFFLVAKLLYKR